ncbi:M23 family metallopeptidase [Nostoc sp. CHAB 5836]|nr:M23 family metallopeptidase [Nostoc sp. CHAB 5836]
MRLVHALMLMPLLGSGAMAADPAPAAALISPMGAGCISSPFGPRSGAGPRASHFHHGIDIPAPAGAWVRAAAAGDVLAIRRTRSGAGLEIELRHAGGLVTRYAHLGTVAPSLANGRRRVAQGEALGRIGRTGITYGTHLHFEVVVGGQRVDPAPFLNLARCGT